MANLRLRAPASSLRAILPFGICFVMAAAEEPRRAAAGADAPDEMAAILKRIVPSLFPDRRFEITRFGATGDGKAVCTTAFRDAIAECHRCGGGTVVVPEGKFLTGSIHLKSQVALHLAKGAEVIFSDRFEDYLPAVLVRVGGIEL